MIEAAFNDDLALLSGALRQEAFRFVLIDHNRRSIYTDLRQWLRAQYPDRPLFELEFKGKDYRQISDELVAIQQGIVLIPDFDWLFQPEQEALCIAFNQRRDFFARRPIALICFLQPSTFLLVPKKIPDWWSLSPLELEFHRELADENSSLKFQPSGLENSSLGGSSAADKEAEIERLLKQIEVADSENLILLQSLYAQLGELYYELSRYPQAREVLDRSLELGIKTGDRNTESQVFDLIGQIYVVRGDYDTALRYLQDSLKIRQEIGDRQGEGATLNNISQIYDARGDYDTALRYLQDSLKIVQEIGDRKGEGATLNNISQIHKARGDYDMALRYLQDSLKIRQEIGDRQGEGVTLNNISQIHQVRGDYDTALRYLQDSLKIAQEIGDRQGEGVTLWNIGDLLLKQGQAEAAVPPLVQAYQIFTQIGSPSVQGVIHWLNVVRAQIGEARFKELARELPPDFFDKR